MPFKEEMHNLTQEILASSEARTAGIAALRDQVGAQLRELDRSHQAMARRQRAALAQGRADLARGSAAAAIARAEGQRQRKAQVSTWLNTVHHTRQAMTNQVRGDLARVRAACVRAEARRKAELNAWLKELERAEARRKAGVNAWLKELERAEARRKAGVNAWLKELERDHAQRSAAIKALMDHVAAERAAGREEWQRLADTMHGQRDGAKGRGGPSGEVEVRAKVGTVTEGLAAVDDRVFQYLANHPDGTRLTEIEREFGLGRLQAGRVLRHLVDEGKAEKRDLCYFAT